MARTRSLALLLLAPIALLPGCDKKDTDAKKAPADSGKDGGDDKGKADGKDDGAGDDGKAQAIAAVLTDTCTNTYPAYWQDPDPKYAGQWKDQKVTNAPPADWKGPVFKLSDKFPAAPVDDASAQAWRDAKYDALFDEKTTQQLRTELAEAYIWDLMRYIQEGNIDNGGSDVEKDWTLCNNTKRNWYHIPFQTYEALSGREFVHGLTREAPVAFSLKAVPSDKKDGDTLNTTMWAVGFYNPTAAHTLGTVWKDGKATLPTKGIAFDEGAVIGKLLFNTATPEQIPALANMPEWAANISKQQAPNDAHNINAFCGCTPKKKGEDKCSMVEDSEQCSRSTDNGTVRLLQFDVAVKDSRSEQTGWVFGTFVADGERKAGEKNAWNRISPLGLMWGNDPVPAGQNAFDNPKDPRKNGFAQEVIFWDTVDMLNASGGTVAAKQPGHLGCNGRLNGPADNANSSCMSCHMTASVHDENLKTPPIIAQFGGITPECVDPSTGKDAAGDKAETVDDVSFADIDGIYFANTKCESSVNMTTASGTNVLKGEPAYPGGKPETWIPLDYSLQLSISLVQWSEWQADKKAEEAAEGPAVRTFAATLPGR